MPFDGYVAGTVAFSGPLKKPEQMRARVALPTLQVVPARRALTARQVAELALRNAEPVVLAYDGNSIDIESAHMIGHDTDLTISGEVGLEEKTAWNVKVNGKLDLGVVQDFDQDLVSSGIADINASLRGPLRDPNVTGRMELKDASFYLSDFPNGIDNAEGTIIFDQRRANIEKFTATTGGGNLSLSGFIGFSGEMIYRIQAQADSVRIRYPEGVSTTANASLTLTGTTTNSLLSGVVTILRSGFTPRTDLGSILASNPVPATPAATQNEFLRGLQFDIRVDTVPNLQLQTTLTSNLQAEADLRLRGSAAKPVLLGRAVISQGEIQFFGNRYTINRGEIGFFNPVRIEPVLDFDLETRIRAVLVNIKLNGPLRKLNVSYRSDPPLQSNDIIALLAVGRAPGTNSSLAWSQALASPGVPSAGTNNLLGQIVAVPISGRLQRFFGVSRLKIDPQLTGLSAVPQARLTIEQQISRDVTLTYVTNLSQANQQIIRLEWDVSQTWSVVAVREENGVFGVDFLFKKRIR
jgi:translocation and assembly module TamB